MGKVVERESNYRHHHYHMSIPCRERGAKSMGRSSADEIGPFWKSATVGRSGVRRLQEKGFKHQADARQAGINRSG
ncbi:unnamed protein product [Linum trigynum]|uniref:Uncharacterized protein n=1 Tax=Linum trigynum TaxID=586398 RepID=A0AAV2GRS0_9ROSI